MPLTIQCDVYSKVGACLLAAMIQDYWHGRGHKNVKTHVFKLDVTSERNEYGVRSNLNAGLPPRGKTISERRREFLG